MKQQQNYACFTLVGSTTVTCKQTAKLNHHYNLKHSFLETFDLVKIPL